MIKRILPALCLLPFILTAQVQLGPCINNGLLPAATDSIQPYSVYIDTSSQFLQGGFQIGDVVDDFILFDTASTQYRLSQILNSGKPVFLTSGSYTCPAYRYTMDQVIPDLVAMFGQQVVFLNIYQLEAHPVTPDVSPYSGTVQTTSQNYTENILMLQEVTYGERRSRAMNSMVAMGAPCPVLLDGPGNEYWNTFGPSPNNGYLITKDGWVFNKYGWISQNKALAIQDINQLLNTTGLIANHNNLSWIAPMANPGNSFTMLTSTSSQPFRLRVTDSAGRLVLEQTIQPYASFVLGEALRSEGTYFVAILAAEHRETFTFIKAK